MKPVVLLGSWVLVSGSLGFHPGGLCLFTVTHMLAFFNNNENFSVQRILLPKVTFMRNRILAFSGRIN